MLNFSLPRFWVIVVVYNLMFICFLAGYANAHPADGKIPRDIRGLYPSSSARAGESINELWFVSPSDQIPASSLSDIEKYMIAGCDKSSPGGGIVAWYTSIFMAVGDYVKAFGYVPDVLTDTELKKVPQYSEFDDAGLSLFRNPITGEWPKLKASEFSPGDVYIRPLTSDEMRYFASHEPTLQHYWYEGKGLNWDCLDAGHPMDQCFTEPVSMSRPPCYIRVYGRSCVLMTNIVFSVGK